MPRCSDLRQPSFGVPAAGAPTRQAAADRLFQILDGSPVYRAAVSQLRVLDQLQPDDWRPPCPSSGFGSAQFMQQDCGAALLDNQLIHADVRDVEEHVRRALQLQHPAAGRGDGHPADRVYERRRDAEIECAVRRCVELGDGMRGELLRRGHILDAVSCSLLPLTRKIREELSPQHIRCTPFEHAHIAYAAATREALDSPDVDLPVRLALGSVVAGDLPPTHAWDKGDVSRPLGLDFDDLPHKQWNEWLHADILRRAQAPAGAAEAAALWGRLLVELDKGICDGPWAADDLDAMYGDGCWRSFRCFGVEQNGSLRACDDAAESLHNDSSSQYDKLRCNTPDSPARAADCFAERIGRGARGWSLELSTDDLDCAYRRALVATPGLAVSAFFHPPSGSVRYLTRPGFCFGLVSAVLYFNAIPACTSSAARRLLGLPVDHFYDDFWLLMLSGLGAVGQAALDAHHRRFGFPLSLKKRKPPALARKYCGVVNDFSRLASCGEVMLYVEQERKDKLLRLCSSARLELPPHSAEVLCGKLRFTLAWSFGRVGLAALQPLQRRAVCGQRWVSAATPAIRRALDFLEDVLRLLPPRTVSLDLPSRPALLCWTDAMCEPDGDGWKAEGGFVVIDPAEEHLAKPLRVFYADEIAGDDVFRYFVPCRGQYIGQLEKLFATVPYRTLPALFSGRQVIHFIDNTWALAAMVKGYAAPIDSGLIVNAYHAYAAGLRTDTFFEYVRSAANIADLPSRGALPELLAVLGRLGLRAAAVRVPACFPPLSSWRAPAREWLAQASVSRCLMPPVLPPRPDAEPGPPAASVSAPGQPRDGEPPRKRQRRSSGHRSGASRRAAHNATGRSA